MINPLTLYRRSKARRAYSKASMAYALAITRGDTRAMKQAREELCLAQKERLRCQA